MKPVCSIFDCRNVGGRTEFNYCDKHYKRWVRHGNPLKTLTKLELPCIAKNCDQVPLYYLKTDTPMCPKHYQRNKKKGTFSDDAFAPVKGKSHIDSKGYVRIWRNRKPYKEHRWVMEQYLGRELYPDETVHHKNGVRHDNRIENLELWCSSHPSGQRVSDQLEWAKELIERYQNTFPISDVG